MPFRAIEPFSLSYKDANYVFMAIVDIQNDLKQE